MPCIIGYFNIKTMSKDLCKDICLYIVHTRLPLPPFDDTLGGYIYVYYTPAIHVNLDVEANG